MGVGGLGTGVGRGFGTEERGLKGRWISTKRRRIIGTGEGGIEMGVGGLGTRVWRGFGIGEGRSEGRGLETKY